MTADTSSESRDRSLTDDLLDDLRQGASRPATPVTPPAEPRLRAKTGTPETAETPTVELKFTPRAWSPLEWAPRPRGGGFTLSVGPVRVSLALPKP
jgi:hypothetical protein